LDILKQANDKYKYEKILIVSPEDNINKYYNGKLIDTEYYSKVQIEYEFNESIIGEVIHQQKLKINKKNKNKKDTSWKLLIILDNCLASNGAWQKSEILLNLFFNSRHFNITLITTTQFPMGFIPELRMNFDYVCAFADDFISHKKRLYDFYFNKIQTFDKFCDMHDSLTYGEVLISTNSFKNKETYFYKPSI
jgi:hypothetical protein